MSQGYWVVIGTRLDGLWTALWLEAEACRLPPPDFLEPFSSWLFLSPEWHMLAVVLVIPGPHSWRSLRKNLAPSLFLLQIVSVKAYDDISCEVDLTKKIWNGQNEQRMNESLGTEYVACYGDKNLLDQKTLRNQPMWGRAKKRLYGESGESVIIRGLRKQREENFEEGRSHIDCSILARRRSGACQNWTVQ